MTSRPIRWGIVGTGRMAEVLARELIELAPQGAVLAAVASRDVSRAREFAGRFNIPRHYDAVAELAAQPDVDAVYIASPPSAHIEHARTCLLAGKAVLCEKPFTTNAREARELIALARTRRSFLMEALWTRFLPNVVALRKTLREGVIGDIQMIIGGGGFIPACSPDYYLVN